MMTMKDIIESELFMIPSSRKILLPTITHKVKMLFEVKEEVSTLETISLAFCSHSTLFEFLLMSKVYIIHDTFHVLSFFLHAYHVKDVNSQTTYVKRAFLRCTYVICE